VLYDRRPTLVELVLFGEALSVIGTLMGMLYTPLVYDYVPRNELGTYSAGANITNRLTGIITLNGVGLFIWAYATLFLPPGGEMARVTFSQPKSKTEVAALCAPVILTNQANTAKRISAEAWYATGAALDYGRGFEIRLKDDDSVKLKEQRDKLNQERTGLLAKQSNAKGFAEAAARKKEVTVQQRHQATADALAEQIKPLTARIEKLDAELAARAEQFRDELKFTLGSQLLADGEQIRAATVNPALVFEYALSRRPASSKIEGTLDALRKVNPNVIDMRLIHRKEHWVLAVSVENTSTNGEGKLGEQVGSTLVTVGGKRLGDALVSPVVPVSTRIAQAIGLDLLVLEDPLDRHVSPVMRVAYWVVSLFGDSPQPERRLSATARALRQPDYCDHVSLRLASDTDNVVRVSAIYEKPIATVTNSADLTAGVSGRFPQLLPGQPVETMNQAVDLYLHTIPAAAQNRLTVGRPFVSAAFAPMKYDYMSGYIWMLILGVGALFITILFARREAKGLIQKRGRIEADAEQAAEEAAESREQHGDKNAVAHYTPRHSIRKLGMAGFGALMVTIAFIQIGPELRLIIWGGRAQAEAVRVVKQKLGGAEQVFTSDAEVRAAEEQRDRSYVFWNEYRFQMPDGKSVEFRALSGSQLKPANSLLDKDGLPTTVWVCYDPKHPQRVTLPFEYSTWFVPGVLVGFGLVCFINGCVLLYFARKPIALPILPDGTPAASRKP
jgi:hypothetical protein